MGNTIFLHELRKNLIAKMCPAVTNNSAWCTKASKDIVFQKLNHNLVVIGFASFGFHSLRNIINSDEDVKVAKRVWERSHEVDAPNIKYLNN